MAATIPNGMTRIVPMIAYEDVAAALGWLASAFGFRERRRFTDPEGRVGQAEMELGDGVIMLGYVGPDYQSPRRHASVCGVARKWMEAPYVIDGVHVYVDDVDEHHRRAREAGATILSGPEDTGYGDRRYRAEDHEGHRWMFAQHLEER